MVAKLHIIPGHIHSNFGAFLVEVILSVIFRWYIPQNMHYALSCWCCWGYIDSPFWNHMIYLCISFSIVWVLLDKSLPWNDNTDRCHTATNTFKHEPCAYLRRWIWSVFDVFSAFVTVVLFTISYYIGPRSYEPNCIKYSIFIFENPTTNDCNINIWFCVANLRSQALRLFV